MKDVFPNSIGPNKSLGILAPGAHWSFAITPIPSSSPSNLSLLNGADTPALLDAELSSPPLLPQYPIRPPLGALTSTRFSLFFCASDGPNPLSFGGEADLLPFLASGVFFCGVFSPRWIGWGGGPGFLRFGHLKLIVFRKRRVASSPTCISHNHIPYLWDFDDDRQFCYKMITNYFLKNLRCGIWETDSPSCVSVIVLRIEDGYHFRMRN